jgi:hypothetical protein
MGETLSVQLAIRANAGEKTCAISHMKREGTYMLEKQPHLFDPARLPQVVAHSQRCKALPAFVEAAYSVAEALATAWRPEVL